jgi:hypothetical protein
MIFWEVTFWLTASLLILPFPFKLSGYVSGKDTSPLSVKIEEMANVLFLAGCASTNNIVVNTDTMRLIEKTAEVAPKGVDGEFVLTVKAAGEQGKVVYQNTELDYRDRRNITVVLSPQFVGYINEQYGVTPQEYFLNKKIQVKGTAKQVKIGFFSNGKPTEKYYYQTHIRVRSPNQIEVLG